MADETETIDDVLARVSQLTKPEMTEEATAYGLDVSSAWTKEEIMENLEAHLLSDDEEAPDDEAEEEDDVPSPADDPEFVPVSDEVSAMVPGEEDFPSGDVRVTQSRGWGHNASARTP